MYIKNFYLEDVSEEIEGDTEFDSLYGEEIDKGWYSHQDREEEDEISPEDSIIINRLTSPNLRGRNQTSLSRFLVSSLAEDTLENSIISMKECNLFTNKKRSPRFYMGDGIIKYQDDVGNYITLLEEEFFAEVNGIMYTARFSEDMKSMLKPLFSEDINLLRNFDPILIGYLLNSNGLSNLLKSVSTENSMNNALKEFAMELSDVLPKLRDKTTEDIIDMINYDIHGLPRKIAIIISDAKNLGEYNPIIVEAFTKSKKD